MLHWKEMMSSGEGSTTPLLELPLLLQFQVASIWEAGQPALPPSSNPPTNLHFQPTLGALDLENKKVHKFIFKLPTRLSCLFQYNLKSICQSCNSSSRLGLLPSLASLIWYQVKISFLCQLVTLLCSQFRQIHFSISQIIQHITK